MQWMPARSMWLLCALVAFCEGCAFYESISLSAMLFYCVKTPFVCAGFLDNVQRNRDSHWPDSEGVHWSSSLGSAGAPSASGLHMGPICNPCQSDATPSDQDDLHDEGEPPNEPAHKKASGDRPSNNDYWEKQTDPRVVDKAAEDMEKRNMCTCRRNNKSLSADYNC